MAYIYNADIYCDDCGNAIKRQVAIGIYNGNGLVIGPACDEYYDFETVDDIVDYLDTLDEREYDSGDYPKGCGDDEESDCPQHCGSHADCINAIDLGSGRPIGDLIGTNLTTDGIEYVIEAVREGGDVADFWRDQFDWIDFDDVISECDICGLEGDTEEIVGKLCSDCRRCEEECKDDDSE